MLNSKLFVFILLWWCYNTSTALEIFKNTSTSNILGDALEKIEKDIADLFRIKKFNRLPLEALLDAFDNLKIEQNSRQFPTDFTLCTLCQITVANILNKVVSMDIGFGIICNLYMTLYTLTITDFCRKLANLELPTLNYIADNAKHLTPELACSILLQNRQCQSNSPQLTWKIEIPKSDNISMHPITSSSKPLKILHLSDFHVSTDYAVGSISDCGYFLCCKKGLGNGLLQHNAGKWGMYYNCDIPVRTYLDTLIHINNTHKDIDVIYYTGDIMDHTIWDTSIEKNSNLIKYIYKTLKESFPNTKIFPVIGNHEATPVNLYPPPNITSNFSQNWLYDLLSEEWQPWLSTTSLSTVKNQGFYTHLLSEKLRIIVLNNNICYNYNWWVLYDTFFLQEQLNWLVEVLTESEKQGQFVHILSHVPVGEKDCIKPWETSFNSIVTRFSHIIKGQFNGHTHRDEIKVFYNTETNEPNNVAFNGGSVTTYQNVNPNYKIYTVDSNNYEVVNAETYIFNLTEANLNIYSTPRWFQLYSLKEAFNLPNLKPTSMDKLAKSLFTNDTRLYQYFRYYIKNGDASIKDGCDNDCKKKLRCNSITTVSLGDHPIDYCK